MTTYKKKFSFLLSDLRKKNNRTSKNTVKIQFPNSNLIIECSVLTFKKIMLHVVSTYTYILFESERIMGKCVSKKLLNISPSNFFLFSVPSYKQYFFLKLKDCKKVTFYVCYCDIKKYFLIFPPYVTL